MLARYNFHFKLTLFKQIKFVKVLLEKIVKLTLMSVQAILVRMEHNASMNTMIISKILNIIKLFLFFFY